MGCPQCQSDDISDSGICLICGYVTSINAEAEGPEAAPESENSETAAGNENDEPTNYSDLTEADHFEAEPEEEPEEERPAWRQELSQRLQAIQQKRQAMGQSRQAEVRDKRPSISPERTQAAKPSIPYTPGILEVPPLVRKPVPGLKTPFPRQKTLQPLDPGSSGEKPTPKETGPRDVQALIDNAIFGKTLQPPSPMPAAAFPDSGVEPPLEDEGKLILLSRTLSGLVDLIIVMLCSGVLLIAADFFSGIIALDTVSYLVFSVLFLLTYFFYSLFFLSASSQTIGMMITDLRVVDADGKRPSTSQLLRRCFGYLASVLVLGLGLLWSLFDRDSQCFHDRISDTRILRL